MGLLADWADKLQQQSPRLRVIAAVLRHIDHAREIYSLVGLVAFVIGFLFYGGGPFRMLSQLTLSGMQLALLFTGIVILGFAIVALIYIFRRSYTGYAIVGTFVLFALTLPIYLQAVNRNQVPIRPSIGVVFQINEGVEAEEEASRFERLVLSLKRYFTQLYNGPDREYFDIIPVFVDSSNLDFTSVRNKVRANNISYLVFAKSVSPSVVNEIQETLGDQAISFFTWPHEAAMAADLVSSFVSPEAEADALAQRVLSSGRRDVCLVTRSAEQPADSSHPVSYEERLAARLDKELEGISRRLVYDRISEDLPRIAQSWSELCSTGTSVVIDTTGAGRTVIEALRRLNPQAEFLTSSFEGAYRISTDPSEGTLAPVPWRIAMDMRRESNARAKDRPYVTNPTSYNIIAALATISTVHETAQARDRDSLRNAIFSAPVTNALAQRSWPFTRLRYVTRPLHPYMEAGQLSVEPIKHMGSSYE